MSREQLALRLIDCIYQAALDAQLWERFVSELSEVYGGAMVGFTLQSPTRPSARQRADDGALHAAIIS